MDKKDHYVKRCVALPGDTLEIKDGMVWINGRKEEVEPGIQLSYKVVTNGQRINSKTVEQLGLNPSEIYFDPSLPGYPAMILTAEMLEKVKELPNVVNVSDNLERDAASVSREIFPLRKIPAGQGISSALYGYLPKVLRLRLPWIICLFTSA